ncbi:hypothetical protein PRZ48_005214 [Zasmidium cellare]|uniref:Uncharacterized protein n=1 Tax=Zasmidium cellare TaxID=395010 RepID=A0ABR0ETA6_ZASCE|nr:hypothetical protein PRZ48_005214 [Zasmidium cellare]
MGPWDPLDLYSLGVHGPRYNVPLSNTPFLRALAHSLHRAVGVIDDGDVFQARLVGIDAENLYFADVRIRSVDGDVQHLAAEAWARDEVVSLTLAPEEWEDVEVGMLRHDLGRDDLLRQAWGREE